MPRIDNLVIGFIEKDAQRLYHLHNYALMVSIRVGDYNTHWVLVDNESSADILYYSAFQPMRIEREWLVPINAPLIGFRETRLDLLGMVTFPMTVGDYPQQITKDVSFLVVNYSSAYNAILGPPTLNAWKVVTSTYHLMIKFPTEYGVGEVWRDQVVARKCYIAMLEMDDYLQTMCIEEQRMIAEPIEMLEEVFLNNSRPERMTKIGTFASPPICQALTAFLRENQDVFAWGHEDMPRIDPSVIVHKLNVSSSFPPIH